MEENGGKIVYTLEGDLTPLAWSLKEAEAKFAAARKKIESSPILAKVKIDEQSLKAAQDAIGKALGAKAYKVKIDTADIVRQITGAVRQGTGGTSATMPMGSSPILGTGSFAARASVPGVGTAAITAAAAIVARPSMFRSTPAAAAMQMAAAMPQAQGVTVNGKSCPQCGSAVPNAAMFCPRCGHDFRGGAIGRLTHGITHSVPYQVARATGVAAGFGVRGLAASMGATMRAGYAVGRGINRMMSGPEITLADLHSAISAGNLATSTQLQSIHDRIPTSLTITRQPRRPRGGGGGGGSGGGSSFGGFGGMGNRVSPTDPSRAAQVVGSSVYTARQDETGTHYSMSTAESRAEARGHKIGSPVRNLIQRADEFRVGYRIKSIKRPGGTADLGGYGTGYAIPYSGDSVLPGGSLSAGQGSPVRRAHPWHPSEIQRYRDRNPYEGENNLAHSPYRDVGSMGTPHFADEMFGPRLPSGNYFPTSRDRAGLRARSYWQGANSPLLGQGGGRFGRTLAPIADRFFGDGAGNNLRTFLGGGGGWAGSAGRMGLAYGAVIEGLGQVADRVDGYNANRMASYNLALRKDDYRYQASQSTEHVLAASLGDSPAANTVANFVPGGQRLHGALATLTGTKFAIDKRMAEARVGIEKGDAIFNSGYQTSSNNIATRQLKNDDKYEAIGLQADADINSIKQERDTAVDEAHSKLGRGAAAKLKKTFDAKIAAVRARAGRDEARQRSIDTQSADLTGQQFDFTGVDNQAATEAAIQNKYTADLNSGDAGTRARAQVLMGKELGANRRLYNQNVTAVVNAAGIGTLSARSQILGSQNMHMASGLAGVDAAKAQAAENYRKATEGTTDQRVIGAARTQYNNEVGVANAQGVRIKTDFWRQDSSLRVGAMAANQSMLGNGFKAASMRNYDNYQNSVNADPEHAGALWKQFQSDQNAAGFDRQMERFSNNSISQSINNESRRLTKYANKGYFQAASAQGIVDESADAIRRANIELRGPEHKEERERRIAAINGNAQAKLEGITKQLDYGNHGEQVSAFQMFGDFGNQKFDDLAEAKRIADGAGGTLDGVNKGSNISSPSTGDDNADTQRMIQILEQISSKLGVQ